MTKWSVIVWANVTRDLREAIAHDLKEATAAFEALGSTADIHVHVFRSQPGGGLPDLVCLPADAADASPAEGLKEILTRAQCWAEADRTLLVLWGHGTRAFPLDTIRTTAPADRRSVASADLVAAEFRAASLRHPDIVGYDACRMATVTTVLTLADCFPDAFFVGSMVPEPASGWPYHDIMRILSASQEPKDVASAMVEAYAASVDSADWCMVALQLSQISPDRGGALPGALETFLLSPAPRDIAFFEAAKGADILDDTNLVDLGALLRRLDPLGLPDDEPTPARAVRRALLDAVIARRRGGSLAGRDGVAAVVGLPWDRKPYTEKIPPWPPAPTWSDLLPDLVPEFLGPAT